MADFIEIKKVCDRNSSISATVIDDFILHYAVAKNNLAEEFDLKIASYRHITQETPASWVRMLKSQYIIHSIFKEDGLLRKYLNHAEIKRRPPGEQEFLKEQLATPWRFCFSTIVDNPESDFYQMEDVFSGDSFLLYSKSTTLTLTEQPALIWFNLIAFNGVCWQTFGPVNAYQSFDQDDIFFFARALNPRIDSEEMLLGDVEKNPVPYMLLLTGGRMPVTVNKKDELLILRGEQEQESLDARQLKDHFKVEYNKGVFRISLKQWDEPPHLAAAYYDEEEKRLTVVSMTDRGFSALAKKMNEHGFSPAPEPQIRIHLSMLFTAEKILKKKLARDPYENLFTPETSPQAKAEIERINHFLQSVMPLINAGKKPNIAALAKEAGVDASLAERIVADAIGRIEAMKKGKR